MAQKSRRSSTDEIFVESSPLAPEDERLDKLFDEMESGSLKTLEDAARQIITLSTTLLGAFFGPTVRRLIPQAYIEYVVIGIPVAFIAFFMYRFVRGRRRRARTQRGV